MQSLSHASHKHLTMLPLKRIVNHLGKYTAELLTEITSSNFKSKTIQEFVPCFLGFSLYVELHQLITCVTSWIVN